MGTLSLTKMFVVASLFVGAGLLGFLTFEEHSELMAERNSMRAGRVQMENDARIGKDTYDWMYHHNVVLPIREAYLKFTLCLMMMSLSVAIMLGANFTAIIPGLNRNRNAG
ncbi:hypothetical protein N9B45_01530 [bacterium]|nr:hypothetical protein [bacterium]MDA7926207.1 hypothetical protein [Mariniblastus sp.]